MVFITIPQGPSFKFIQYTLVVRYMFHCHLS